MAIKIGIIRSDGSPSYGVDLNSITPSNWRSYFSKANFKSRFLSPNNFKHLEEIFKHDVIANPYGGVIPESKDHIVTSGLKSFIEEGGIFLEVMPPPFYLCYFEEDGTLVSMIDIIAGQFDQILTKSDGFDHKLKLTKIGEEILSLKQIPDSVFLANKGAVLSTLYNYSSKPGLSLIITDQNEPILDILTVGKGRIVRWGCNLEATFQSFLFNSFIRIIEYLFKDPSFKGTSQTSNEFIISVSPVNYWVGNPSRQRISITILTGKRRIKKDLKLAIKSWKTQKLFYQDTLKTISSQSSCITFKTDFDSKNIQDCSVDIFDDETKYSRKVFKPYFTARHTIFRDKDLKKAIPQTRKPEGFGDFWKLTLDEAFEVDIDPLEKLDYERSNSKISLYRVYLRSLKDDRVHGWFCRPKESENGSAILLLPGYSDASKFIPLDLIEKGCSIFALDPRGHGESVKKIKRSFPGLITQNIMDKFQYPYRGIYIDCLKAMDYLLSNPHVDEKRIGVIGISQGGGLALLTAALDERVSFTIADSPFLSDINHGIELASDGPYVELSEFIDKNQFSRDVILENLSFFDIVNFVEKVRCPTLMSVGLMDTICPPITAYATYNKLKCPKRLEVYPQMGHFCGVYGHQEIKLEWIKKFLNVE